MSQCYGPSTPDPRTTGEVLERGESISIPDSPIQVKSEYPVPAVSGYVNAAPTPLQPESPSSVITTDDSMSRRPMDSSLSMEDYVPPAPKKLKTSDTVLKGTAPFSKKQLPVEFVFARAARIVKGPRRARVSYGPLDNMCSKADLECILRLYFASVQVAGASSLVSPAQWREIALQTDALRCPWFRKEAPRFTVPLVKKLVAHMCERAVTELFELEPASSNFIYKSE